MMDDSEILTWLNEPDAKVVVRGKEGANMRFWLLEKNQKYLVFSLDRGYDLKHLRYEVMSTNDPDVFIPVQDGWKTREEDVWFRTSGKLLHAMKKELPDDEWNEGYRNFLTKVEEYFA